MAYWYYMYIFKWGIIFLLIYMTGLLIAGAEFLFIDYFNLLMHEAGHLLLSVMPTTITFLGGTFLQLLIPIICGIVLVIQQSDWFGGGLCLWWIGENLVNIGRYMADALYQLLPLVGNGEHDWAHLFTEWNLLYQAETIGQSVCILGTIIMITAILWLIAQQIIIFNTERTI